MNREKLRDEIEIELERMETTVSELRALGARLGSGEPSNLEKAGAGACLAQFYGGIERVLVRICKHRGVQEPTGADWHEALFRMFCEPPANGLPALFDQALESLADPYRRFCHVFRHGYGILLDWNRMKPGIESVEKVFHEFAKRARGYLDSLDDAR
jgi:hypothetical protein